MEKRNLKFSVLISVYYKEIAEYLDLSLESITDKQVLKPAEIVLIKDGPLTKELDRIIEKYVNKYPNLFKIISLKKNCGLGIALNVGLKNCSYEFVARMDGDDISKAERFKKQVDVFKNNPDIDICGSWIDEFQIKNRKLEVQSIRKVPETNDEIYKNLKFICAFNHPTVMFKKSKVLLAGNYNGEFNKLEDYYLWVRMALNSCNFYNIQESLLYFRITENTSKRRSGIKMFLGDLRLHSYFLKNNFINYREFLRNIIIWGSYRILPIKWVKILQKKLRK